MSSGINEIKRKAKLSIDEMYDNQPVGKLDIQEESNPEGKQSNHPAVQKESNPVAQPSNNPTNQEIQLLSHKTGHPFIQQNVLPENQLSINPAPIYQMAKQQSPRNQTYKMTFNLTEETFKAFNDLYAQRMLQGRKTEKSEMIREAIEWLIKMEKEFNH